MILDRIIGFFTAGMSGLVGSLPSLPTAVTDFLGTVVDAIDQLMTSVAISGPLIPWGVMSAMVVIVVATVGLVIAFKIAVKLLSLISGGGFTS